MIEIVAQKHGCEVIRTKVGEIHVARRMVSEKATIGGEGNGGIILPELHSTRDAPLGAALILSHIAALNMPLSRIVDNFPRLWMRKEAFPVSSFNVHKFQDLCSEFFPSWEISTLDGLRMESEEEWIHIRRSNTEPVVRVIVESNSKRKCEEHLHTISKMLRQ
jgi:phosphomannomutase